MRVTDTQCHLWELNRPDRAWKQPDATPHLPYGFSAPDLLAVIDKAGVDRVVLVPPTWAPDDSAHDAALKYPDRFAVVGRFDPLEADAQAQLESWLQRPRMIGLKMTLTQPQALERVRGGTFDWVWSACQRLGIPVMCLIPGGAASLEGVARKFPDLTLVLDHMAGSRGPSVEGAFATLPHVLSLAQYPKVLVKISNVPMYSQEPYPFKDAHPYIKQIFDTFGAQRMMWASDLTSVAFNKKWTLEDTYRQTLGLVRDNLDFLTESDKALILSGTAEKELHWPAS